MWFIFRLILAVGAIFYRFHLKKNSSVAVKAPNGQTYRVHSVKNKHGKVVRTLVYFYAKNSFYFRIVNEGRLIKLLKFFGLVTEMQTGNAEFDEHHYIAVDHPKILAEISFNDQFRQNMIDLKMQWSEISADGKMGVIFKTEGSKTPTEEDIVKMSQFVESLQKIQVSKADPYYAKIFAFELFMFGVTGYGIGTYAEFLIYDTLSLLDPWELLFKGVACGLLVFLAWMLSALFILRKSSRAPLLIADLGLWCLLGLLIAGPQVFVDLNQVLDKSQPTLTRALIEDKYSRTTGSGKNRRTRFYLELKFNENPYHIPRRFRITAWDYHRFTKDHGIQFSIRRGAFAAAYIDEMEPVTVIPDVDSSRGELPQEQISSIAEALKWRAASPLSESSSEGERRIVRYNKDQVKSDEPLLNGAPHGLAKYWHPNGKLYSEIPYQNGEKHGEFKLYREDGTLEQHLSYKNGKPHGLLQWFNENGQLSHRAVYIEGQHFPISEVDLQKVIESSNSY